MSKIIAIINQKGGVGKTTTAINFGAALSLAGMKVILIDLDIQGSLTFSFGIPKNPENSIVEVLTGKISINDAIIKRDNLSIIPSKVSLATIEKELPQGISVGDILKTYLAELKEYDYIIIDCPPNLGYITGGVLVVSDELIVPMVPEVLPFEGLTQLKQNVDMIKKLSNPKLKIAGVLATRYDSRKNLYRAILDQIRSNFPDMVFKTVIRENVALSEAPASQTHIFDYKMDSNGAEDYLNFCKEYLTKGA